MKVYAFGEENAPVILLLPGTCCHWKGNFGHVIPLLSDEYRVLCVSYDGFDETEQTEFPTMLEETAKIEDYLKVNCGGHIRAAYGCSLGGACLTRLLALGELPVKRAIIDGGITPYQLPYLIRKLLLARDVLSFKLAANNRKILEAAFLPERFTLPGRDHKKEYDAIEAYLKTYSDQTIRNIFWSGNNYVLPKTPAKIGTKITYWYGDEEKKDRRSNIRFIKHYFPQARIHGIPKMAHAELVMIYPEEFCRYFDKFMCR